MTEEQCRARKDFPPQEGERCSMLPHADWMPHSWIPWGMAVRMQAEIVMTDLLNVDLRAKGILPLAGFGLPIWNDETGRTKEEVLALFDRAIAKESQ